jgi:hypothetical protein
LALTEYEIDAVDHAGSTQELLGRGDVGDCEPVEGCSVSANDPSDDAGILPFTDFQVKARTRLHPQAAGVDLAEQQCPGLGEERWQVSQGCLLPGLTQGRGSDGVDPKQGEGAPADANAPFDDGGSPP